MGFNYGFSATGIGILDFTYTLSQRIHGSTVPTLVRYGANGRRFS